MFTYLLVYSLLIVHMFNPVSSIAQDSDESEEDMITKDAEANEDDDDDDTKVRHLPDGVGRDPAVDSEVTCIHQVQDD